MRRLRSAALFLLPLLLLPAGAPTAQAGGAGDGALGMSVTVNGAGGSNARAVRAGGTVLKQYRLVNRGEADLYGVRIADPGVPGDLVRCPAKPLAALRTMVCTARFRALPGTHTATARATGDIPSLNKRLTADARSGYEGVAGALRLTETVRVGSPAGRRGRTAPRAAPGPGTAVVGYTVTNLGNHPVHTIRLTDAVLGAGIDCGTGPAATLPVLAPGASAGCTATVRRPPGTHRSAGTATGSDRVTTFGEHGETVPAPELTAHASALFRVVAAVGDGGAGGGGGGGGDGGVPGAPPSVRGGVRPGAVGTGSGAGTGTAGGAGAGAGGAAGAPGAPGAPGGLAGAAGVTGGAPGGGAGLAAAPGGAGAGAVRGAGAGGAGAGAGAAAGTVAGAGVVAGARPPGARPPGVPPARPPGAADGTTRPGDGITPPATRVPTAVPADEGLLPRLQRRYRELPRLGVVLTLLLLLIPAAIAAALFGSRHH